MLQQEEELAKQKQQQQQELQQQKQQQQQKQIQQQKMVIEQQQERLEQNKMEVEFSQQQHVRFEREPTEVDEEDSCPPDLEAVELQQQQQQQQPQPQQVHQQPEPQQVHQAPPPPSVPQQQDPFAGLDPTSDLVRNLAIAIKTSMETYKGQGGTYEPSADELIDVLKNLENLAAQNPALYRAIVDQTNGHQEVMEHHEQQGFSEVDQQQQSVVYEEHYQESGEINGVEQVDHAAVMEHDQMPSVQVEQKSPEQIKQEQKEAKMQAEVDREHEENMRALREKKKREKEPPPPPK